MVDRLIGEGFVVRVIDDFSGGNRLNLAHLVHESSLTIHETDIRQIAIDDKVFSGAKVLLHFAGIGDIVPSIERPVDYLEVNVQGTVRVLESARYHNIQRVVYAASSSCYGLAATPTAENHPIDCRYPYALSKYLGNDLSTPRPEYGFAGLKPGDRWCLCAARWEEARRAGFAPPVLLEATHIAALSVVELAHLKAHALDAP